MYYFLHTTSTPEMTLILHGTEVTSNFHRKVWKIKNRGQNNKVLLLIFVAYCPIWFIQLKRQIMAIISTRARGFFPNPSALQHLFLPNKRICWRNSHINLILGEIQKRVAEKKKSGRKKKKKGGGRLYLLECSLLTKSRATVFQFGVSFCIQI